MQYGVREGSPVGCIIIIIIIIIIIYLFIYLLLLLTMKTSEWHYARTLQGHFI